MFNLIRQLVRPYRGTLFIILIAMVVETAMSLAAPWPLKVIIDNVAGGHRLPLWLRDMLGAALGNESKMHIALLAGIAAVLIAAIGAIAGYIDSYFTESAGQYVAHDLRVRTFHHLQRLSLGYYDTHQTRQSAEHHYHRRSDDPEFRVVLDAWHPGRCADTGEHAGAHVLVELAVHSGCPGRHAVSALLRVPLQEGHQKTRRTRSATSRPTFSPWFSRPWSRCP